MQRTNSTERRKRSITAKSLRKNRGTRLSLLRPLPLIAFCPRRNTHSFDRNWDLPLRRLGKTLHLSKPSDNRALFRIGEVMPMRRQSRRIFHSLSTFAEVNFCPCCGCKQFDDPRCPRILKSTDRTLHVCKTHGVDY